MADVPSDDPTRRSLRLRDGRVLSYAVYGDPDGFPVLNCHGGLVCRIDVEPNVADFEALRARVISPDRPGVGRSDRSPGRVTADFADDVRELLDALAIDRCAVMGWSFGGQYAAAIAARLPDRVQRIAIIAGCLPLDDPDTFAHLNTMDRRFTWLSRHARPIARLSFAAFSRYANRAPQRVTDSEAKKPPTPDGATLRAHGDWFGRAVAEGTRNAAGVVDDYLAAVAPWGFGLDELTVATHIYQGTEDSLVPPQWADELARRIPDARLTTYKGEGHMIAVSHRGDVVRDLLA